MQKIKNAIKGHRHGHREDEYDTTTGATTYNETGMDTGIGGAAMQGHHRQEQMAGEVVAERPVAVGVAEVPVVVTEQERLGAASMGVSERGAMGHQSERVGEEVCGQKVFTEVEDRPVVRERVERIVEHRPVEKQFVVETRYVGEREVTGATGTEIVDVKERVVEAAEPGPRCPANAGAVMNEVVSGVQGTGMGGVGTHHHHHATDRTL